VSQRSDSTIERSISHDQALFICVCARACVCVWPPTRELVLFGRHLFLVFNVQQQQQQQQQYHGS